MSLIHRYYVFANASGASWVRDQFAALGDGGASETNNCRRELTAAGDPGGTTIAYCCSFACTDAMRTTLLALSVPAGVTWYRVAALGPTEGVVQGTNSVAGAGQVSHAFNLDAVLALEGYGFSTVGIGI